MSKQRFTAHRHQRGIVLISSLLLLLVITILALAMFRGMGLAERIAGNVREKQRALHSAEVAEQYAEWLLGSGNIPTSTTTCSSAGAANNTTYNQVLVCQNGINPATSTPFAPNPATLPWTDGSGNPLGYTYTLPTSTQMYLVANNGSLSNTYYKAPAFYIQYMGPAADGSGNNIYKIDAVGYGGSPLSVAVVESTYQIGAAPGCPTC